jgi:hypothetical protein
MPASLPIRLLQHFPHDIGKTEDMITNSVLTFRAG